VRSLIFLLAITLASQVSADDVIHPVSGTDYVARVKLNDAISIRLLILKHSVISMADRDAELAIQAVSVASARGLQIEEIGNHFINRDGRIQRFAMSKTLYGSAQLKDFINQQMKISAAYGDTLVVFTIGHGFSSGLQNIGERRILTSAIAGAAAENSQRTLWWQLSCHATAGLPSISELPAAEQELFSMVASSDASETSAEGVQGRIMQKVFVAIANDSDEIDPDHDNVITAGELRRFLTNIGGIGRRVFAKSADTVIFGRGFNPGMIPILDPYNPNRTFPENYLPVP